MSYRRILIIILGILIFSSAGLASDLPVKYKVESYDGFQAQFEVDLLTLKQPSVRLSSWDQYYHLAEDSPVPPEWSTKGVPVILIHGFQTSAVTYRDYEQAERLTFEELVKAIVQDLRVTKNDVQIYGCTWPTKTVDLEQSAKMLREAIKETGNLQYRDDLIIIGHSMGGLLARIYREEYGGQERIQRVITLSTPHEGVPPALVYNYLQSKLLLKTFALAVNNPAGLDMEGLRDTFATQQFYQTTEFTPKEMIGDASYSNLFSNPLLTNLNNKYPLTDQYKLAAGDISGDQTIRWGFKLINQSYQGLTNDGLVAKYSALGGKKEGLIRKTNHSGITEDPVIIDKIIEELKQQIYYFDLPQRLFARADYLRVEVSKQVNDKSYVITDFKLNADEIRKADASWSSKEQVIEPTIWGLVETVRLGLAGKNIVKVYQEGAVEPDWVFELDGEEENYNYLLKKEGKVKSKN